MTTDLSNTLNKRQRYLRNALWYGGFWLLLTLWLRFALPESMMGWERHQLFRFSAEYLTFFSIYPYPVLLYIQAFFTQFYLYPLLGAAVISGLLVVGMGAWRRLSGRYWTGLVWAAFMLPLIPYFNLLWILVWLVLLGGGLLINLRGLSTGWRLAVTTACGLAGGLLIQENVTLAIVFWSLVSGLRTHSWRDGLYGLAAGLVGSGIGLLLVRLCYPFFHPADLTEWSLLRLRVFSLFTYPVGFFYCLIFIRILTYIGLPILMIALPLTALLPQQTAKWKRITALTLAGLLAMAAAYLNLRYQVEDFYLVDRLAAEGHWDEAADVAEYAFIERARPRENTTVFTLKRPHHTRTAAARFGVKPASFYDIQEEGAMGDILKISLLANRQATNKLFAYNGSFHFPLLFPLEILHSPSSYMMAFYYTQHGLYAEALHLLYDFVTMGRINTAMLKPLLWNSVVVGDYEPCRKFIRFFEQSLFHKDIARRYAAYIDDTAWTARQPEIIAARKYLSTCNYSVLAYQPDNNIAFCLPYEGGNRAVYEYALALCLVYKDHGRILAELPKIRQTYPKLPLHIQEAVLANFTLTHLDEAPDDIHPGIKARYKAFMQAYGLYMNGYISFRKLRKQFEDSYWYHAMFNEIIAPDEASTFTEQHI